jgi:hypothetical protein
LKHGESDGQSQIVVVNPALGDLASDRVSRGGPLKEIRGSGDGSATMMKPRNSSCYGRAYETVIHTRLEIPFFRATKLDL